LHCKQLGHEKLECQKLKKEQEDKKVKDNASKSSGSGGTSSTIAKVAVTSSDPTPKDDTVHLFWAFALTHTSPSAKHVLETQEELISKNLVDQ